jgi:hypothetical protein
VQYEFVVIREAFLTPCIPETLASQFYFAILFFTTDRQHLCTVFSSPQLRDGSSTDVTSEKNEQSGV